MATAAGLVVTLEAQTAQFHARMAAAEVQLQRMGRAPIAAARGIGMLQSGMRNLAFRAAAIPGPIGNIATGMLTLTEGTLRATVAVTGFLAAYAATTAVLEFFKRRAQEVREELQLSQKLAERIVGEASGRAGGLLQAAQARMPKDLTQRFREEMLVIQRQRTQVRQLLAREEEEANRQALRETLKRLEQTEALTREFFEIESFKEFQEQQMKLWQPLFDTLHGLMSNFFIDLKDEGLSAFANLADNILNIWFDMLARMAAAKVADLLFGLIPGAAKGFKGSTVRGNISPVFSAQMGGAVGFLAHTRMVDPSVFFGAPRFARGGLVGDEVPIIAHRGETVLPRGATAGGGEMVVHVTQHFNVAALDARGVQELLLQQRGVIAKAVLDVAQESRAYRVAFNRA